jgi:hypothetical protein
VHMGDEGLLPDNLMLTAVARAFTGEVQMRCTQTEESNQNQKKIQSLSAAEVWTTQDWGKLQVLYIYIHIYIFTYIHTYVYIQTFIYTFMCMIIMLLLISHLLRIDIFFICLQHDKISLTYTANFLPIFLTHSIGPTYM